MSQLVKKLESVMTSTEKEKLYKAIGYDESAPPTNYPPEFIEFKFQFTLDEIKLLVIDDQTLPVTSIMSISVKTLKMEFEQRPSASAMKSVT